MKARNKTKAKRAKSRDVQFVVHDVVDKRPREFQIVVHKQAPETREIQVAFDYEAPETREIRVVYHEEAPNDGKRPKG